MNLKYIVVAAASLLGLAGAAVAHGTEHAASSAPGEIIKPTFARAISNLPGKSLIAVEVIYPPGGVSHPHRHANSAFIYGYVVSGSIKSQVEGEPLRVYKAGETFYEDPGSHHLAGGNASKTKPAKLLAVFVVDSDDKELTTFDK